ncbi:MAG: tRNA pseudouridine(55) synthase TruB [Clostridia bacterium]|nr:tRNA pseudouridine(55) synthase TruB [Clostridia bacterium]
MNGIILINKNKGCTSHDIVYKVKKMLNEKVGHTGTLDPMATGVLPLLIGKGTLCSKYLINHDKTYKVKLQLGSKTETADAEGKVIEEKEVGESTFNENNVLEVLKCFVGKQKQVPPIYSAIKVNGKKLYEYARSGQNIEIQPREIEIYNINLIQVEKDAKQIDFEVSCSKGTYIRSLCEDIATKLGTVGFMTELQRIQVGEFNIKDTISVEELEKELEQENKLHKNYFISLEKLFENKESIELNNKKLQLFLNGVKLSMELSNDIYKVYNTGKFIGIGIVENNLLKRDIIL